MEKKLIPAHIHFVKWFIRIRWFAVFILIISNYIVKHLFNISIQEIPVYILSMIKCSSYHYSETNYKKGEQQDNSNNQARNSFSDTYRHNNTNAHPALFRWNRESTYPLLFLSFDHCKLNILDT